MKTIQLEVASVRARPLNSCNGSSRSLVAATPDDSKPPVWLGPREERTLEPEGHTSYDRNGLRRLQLKPIFRSGAGEFYIGKPYKRTAFAKEHIGFCLSRLLSLRISVPRPAVFEREIWWQIAPLIRPRVDFRLGNTPFRRMSSDEQQVAGLQILMGNCDSNFMNYFRDSVGNFYVVDFEDSLDFPTFERRSSQVERNPLAAYFLSGSPSSSTLGPVVERTQQLVGSGILSYAWLSEVCVEGGLSSREAQLIAAQLVDRASNLGELAERYIALWNRSRRVQQARLRVSTQPGECGLACLQYALGATGYDACVGAREMNGRPNQWPTPVELAAVAMSRGARVSFLPRPAFFLDDVFGAMAPFYGSDLATLELHLDFGAIRRAIAFVAHSGALQVAEPSLGDLELQLERGGAAVCPLRIEESARAGQFLGLHYVVVTHIGERYVYLFDPGPRGRGAGRMLRQRFLGALRAASWLDFGFVVF